MVCAYSDLPGDMNNDGVLNALDASAVLKYIFGMGTAANPEVYDLNGDNTVNALDASVILKSCSRFLNEHSRSWLQLRECFIVYRTTRQRRLKIIWCR